MFKGERVSMVSRQLSAARWRPLRAGLALPHAPTLHAWLGSAASLTRRLQQACGSETLQVRLLQQQWRLVTAPELAPFARAVPRRMLQREVLLCCGEQPWVYAVTLLPVATLRHSQWQFGRLGARPLGALLFADPTLWRGGVEVTRVTMARAGEGWRQGERLWARRSLFRRGGWPLLVSELFLSAAPCYGDR